MKYNADDYQKSIVCTRKYYNNPKIKNILKSARTVLFYGNTFAVVLSYILAKNNPNIYENIAISFGVAIVSDIIFFLLRHRVEKNLYIKVIERENETLELLQNRIIYRFHSTFDDNWYQFDISYDAIQKAYYNDSTTEGLFFGEIPAIRSAYEVDLDYPDKCEKKMYPAISIYDYFNAGLANIIKRFED